MESGWKESYALMESGDVLLWRPYDDLSQHLIKQSMQKLGILDIEVLRTSDGIQCITWDFEQPMFRLPPIPSNLPDLNGNNDEEVVKLVKSAGMLDHQIVGLTNKGHVLMFQGSPAIFRAEEGNGNREMEINGLWIYVCCSPVQNCH